MLYRRGRGEAAWWRSSPAAGLQEKLYKGEVYFVVRRTECCLYIAHRHRRPSGQAAGLLYLRCLPWRASFKWPSRCSISINV
ncbi:hypothetical protein BDZ91DRAFT_401136 [Kalaharituber pfeilii]|nr:hypothetical protein BDZ91DRAFT_401136 [Kalaharituber pfeilii]